MEFRWIDNIEAAARDLFGNNFDRDLFILRSRHGASGLDKQNTRDISAKVGLSQSRVRSIINNLTHSLTRPRNRHIGRWVLGDKYEPVSFGYKESDHGRLINLFREATDRTERERIDKHKALRERHAAIKELNDLKAKIKEQDDHAFCVGDVILLRADMFNDKDNLHAIVVSSADSYDVDSRYYRINPNSYQLYVMGHGYSAWHSGDTFTLIRRAGTKGISLIEKWKKEHHDT